MTTPTAETSGVEAVIRYVVPGEKAIFYPSGSRTLLLAGA